jgi:rubrerythrin
MPDETTPTGVSNDVYNLVSILYHDLQGAENYARYAADAEQSGDQELVDFFREMQRTDSQLSGRILGLLRDRLNRPDR